MSVWTLTFLLASTAAADPDYNKIRAAEKWCQGSCLGISRGRRPQNKEEWAQVCAGLSAEEIGVIQRRWSMPAEIARALTGSAPAATTPVQTQDAAAPPQTSRTAPGKTSPGRTPPPAGGAGQPREDPLGGSSPGAGPAPAADPDAPRDENEPQEGAAAPEPEHRGLAPGALNKASGSIQGLQDKKGSLFGPALEEQALGSAQARSAPSGGGHEHHHQTGSAAALAAGNPQPGVAAAALSSGKAAAPPARDAATPSSYSPSAAARSPLTYRDAAVPAPRGRAQALAPGPDPVAAAALKTRAAAGKTKKRKSSLTAEELKEFEEFDRLLQQAADSGQLDAKGLAAANGRAGGVELDAARRQVELILSRAGLDLSEMQGQEVLSAVWALGLRLEPAQQERLLWGLRIAEPPAPRQAPTTLWQRIVAWAKSLRR
ncbi:MAG: hypothetical protein AAB320_08445 [Elusimicrobiota bacterium]